MLAVIFWKGIATVAWASPLVYIFAKIRNNIFKIDDATVSFQPILDPLIYQVFDEIDLGSQKYLLLTQRLFFIEIGVNLNEQEKMGKDKENITEENELGVIRNPTRLDFNEKGLLVHHFSYLLIFLPKMWIDTVWFWIFFYFVKYYVWDHEYTDLKHCIKDLYLLFQIPLIASRSGVYHENVSQYGKNRYRYCHGKEVLHIGLVLTQTYLGMQVAVRFEKVLETCAKSYDQYFIEHLKSGIKLAKLPIWIPFRQSLFQKVSNSRYFQLISIVWLIFINLTVWSRHSIFRWNIIFVYLSDQTGLTWSHVLIAFLMLLFHKLIMNNKKNFRGQN